MWATARRRYEQVVKRKRSGAFAAQVKPTIVIESERAAFLARIAAIIPRLAMRYCATSEFSDRIHPGGNCACRRLSRRGLAINRRRQTLLSKRNHPQGAGFSGGTPSNVASENAALLPEHNAGKSDDAIQAGLSGATATSTKVSRCAINPWRLDWATLLRRTYVNRHVLAKMSCHEITPGLVVW